MINTIIIAWDILLSFNPYFIGLPILIITLTEKLQQEKDSFNPYFIGLPILIRNNCLNTISTIRSSFNPYFIGLPILILKNY